MSDIESEQFKAYKEDKRIPCRYGAKCYQKNPAHQEKYKHPPTKDSNIKNIAKGMTVGKKRKKILNNSLRKKIKKTDDKVNEDNSHSALSTAETNIDKNEDEINEDDSHSAISTAETNVDKNNDKTNKIIEDSNSSDIEEHVTNPNNSTTIASLLKDIKVNVEDDKIDPADAQAVISHLFLTKMSEDFFQLYEFCKTISKENPFDALKALHLQLVGPYDVFKEDFLNAKVEDREALLRHWRYYYDPPEFQTVITDSGKDGLHFGYWRDNASEKPVFVAKNKATVNCVIEPVAENIFGALDVLFGEKLKSASVFEKTRIAQLHQKLKNFAKETKIILDKNTAEMQAREKKVVTRTFHKAGIVVDYDKKTQLGYRNLAISNNQLQEVLKQIENSQTLKERSKPMSKLEEVIRLATIAADECDFGTPLELGHDLFSSGISYVQTKALNLLSLAYSLLQRQQFLEIIQAHLKNRKKSLNLSVLQYES